MHAIETNASITMLFFTSELFIELYFCIFNNKYNILEIFSENNLYNS